MESEKEIQDAKVYEVSYIILPTIAEESISGEEQKIKDMIISFKGTLISGETPRMIDLAYQMEKTIANKKNKFNEGYFGWLKFEMSPETILEFKKMLDLKVEVIRSLIIKTVRENTYFSKKPVARRENTRSRSENEKNDEEVEEAEPINEEVIDKEIDALVTE